MTFCSYDFTSCQGFPCIFSDVILAITLWVKLLRCQTLSFLMWKLRLEAVTWTDSNHVTTGRGTISTHLVSHLTTTMASQALLRSQWTLSSFPWPPVWACSSSNLTLGHSLPCSSCSHDISFPSKEISFSALSWLRPHIWCEDTEAADPQNPGAKHTWGIQETVRHRPHAEILESSALEFYWGFFRSKCGVTEEYKSRPFRSNYGTIAFHRNFVWKSWCKDLEKKTNII